MYSVSEPALSRWSITSRFRGSRQIFCRRLESGRWKGCDIKAMVHITSDGFMNLARVEASVGFPLDAIPEPPPIFALIQEKGGVPIEEMYTVFNMGIGFCLVVGPQDVKRVLALLQQAGEKPCILGKAIDDKDKAVMLTRQKIVGTGHTFERL